MKIVIDIDEGMVKSINENPFGLYNGRLYNAIREGIPLPKGHGRLIDADRYRKDFLEGRTFEPMKTLDLQPTIIEADKGN